MLMKAATTGQDWIINRLLVKTSCDINAQNEVNV